VPYFETMLFGGLAENITSKPIPLKACNSDVFMEILKFVWESEVSLKDMNMSLLLDFLETCRFFCLEGLVDAIIEHVKNLLSGNGIVFKDCLVAFEFTDEHKFIAVSELILDYIGKNLSMKDIDEFGSLKENSMKKVLQYERSTCSDIVRFMAFTKWLEKNETLAEPKRIEILNLFNLSKFTDEDLKFVRKSNLFDGKVICEVLEERLEAKNHLIKESKPVKFRLDCGPNGRTLQKNTLTQFDVPSEYQNHFVNEVEFSLFSLEHSHCNYWYSLKSSQDGQIWIPLDARYNVRDGYQNISFERRKMKFIAVKLLAGESQDNYDADGLLQMQDTAIIDNLWVRMM